MKDFFSYKTEITDHLTNFLEQKQRELKNSYFTEGVFERLLPLAVGGKMLRGSLLINTYQQLSGQKFTKEVLSAAVALELAQTSFLIHDDIIDQDELRRGQTTLHHQYTQRAQQKKYQQPDHVGASLAICVGDLIFFLVYELLAGDLVKLFSQQFSLVALGEMHDVELSLMNGNEVSKDSILQMYLDKTSSYSVCLPLMAGAVLAKQDQKLVLQLNELGQTLGLIFQIKDDELGLFGDEEKTGKPVGADIRESKKTLYYYYLLQEVPTAFEKNGVEKILSLMKKHRVQQQVTKDLEELKNTAQQQIKKLPTKLKQMLTQFLDKTTNRIR